MAILLGASSLFACSCIIQTEQQKIDWAEEVFTGKVLEFEKALMSDYKYATIEILNSSKGNFTRTQIVELKTPKDSAMCGINFEENKTYKVFARYVEGKLYSELCDGTYSLEVDENKVDLPPLKNDTNPHSIIYENFDFSQSYDESRNVINYDLSLTLPNPCYTVIISETQVNGVVTLNIDANQLTRNICVQVLQEKTYSGEIKVNGLPEKLEVYLNDEEMYSTEFETQRESLSFFDRFVNWLKNLF